MPKVRLTHRNIAGLTAGRWLTDYWDEGLPGFGVRAHHNGRKSYVVRYAVADGPKRRLTLCSYPVLSMAKARVQAKAILPAVARGEDPQVDKLKERKAETFGELALLYLERHAKAKKRSWKEDHRILQVDLLPRWNKRKAIRITRGDVAEVLDAIVGRGAPIMANRVKALVSKIFNFGISRDVVAHNPCLGVSTPAKERQRDRVLSEAEICRLGRALELEDRVAAATFQMRLLTAQRGVEVLRMRWEHINADWWTIRPEDTKNGLAHRVPLAPAAIALLDELRPLTGRSPRVFASPRRKGAPITSIQKTAERLARRAELDFVPHDLRRTAASFMTSMGISRLVVSKILNHVESGITAVYDRHSYDAEKRQALDQWAEQVERILQGSTRGLSEDELHRLWQALDGESPVMAATFKMQLFTARRSSEVLRMRWEDIADEGWTIPPHHVKAGPEQRVALSPQALALLQDLRSLTGHTPWVFASRRTGAPLTRVHKAVERIAERAQVDFVPDDLQRTGIAS